MDRTITTEQQSNMEVHILGAMGKTRIVRSLIEDMIEDKDGKLRVTTAQEADDYIMLLHDISNHLEDVHGLLYPKVTAEKQAA